MKLNEEPLKNSEIFTPIRTTLTVHRKEFLTPHLIRIYLRGDGVEKIRNTTVGVNNKILIPPEGLNEIFFPEMDEETRKWKPQPDAIRPFIRTYTHRGIHPSENELWIDFVTHHDGGPATSWAIRAVEGDKLGIMMKEGKKKLYTPAANYFLVGDAAAVPVLSCILEELPSSASGICIIEVYGQEDEIRIETRADIQMIWLHNPHPETGSELYEIAKKQHLPAGNRFSYIAAEYRTVRELRNYLRKEKQWTREEMYAFSYWKSGVAEDKSQTDRRQERDRMIDK